jgi:hypothetical protein
MLMMYMYVNDLLNNINFLPSNSPKIIVMWQEFNVQLIMEIHFFSQQTYLCDETNEQNTNFQFEVTLILQLENDIAIA